MKEIEIQDQIRLALGRNPDLVLFRNNIGVGDVRGCKVRFGVGGPGGADIIGCYRGRFVGVEIKTATGRQSPEQILFQNLIRAKGGIYVVLRSVEEALAWVADLEKQ